MHPEYHKRRRTVKPAGSETGRWTCPECGRSRGIETAALAEPMETR